MCGTKNIGNQDKLSQAKQIWKTVKENNNNKNKIKNKYTQNLCIRNDQNDLLYGRDKFFDPIYFKICYKILQDELQEYIVPSS